MTDDLFPEAVQDSPYVAFVKRHGIVTHYCDGEGVEAPWSAWSGGLSLDEMLEDLSLIHI